VQIEGLFEFLAKRENGKIQMNLMKNMNFLYFSAQISSRVIEEEFCGST
jgi:hypothetical protein